MHYALHRICKNLALVRLNFHFQRLVWCFF